MSTGEFPLRLVAVHQSETGIWRGRRGVGQAVATGHLSFGGPGLASAALVVADDAEEAVQLTALLGTRALQLVLKRYAGGEGWRALVDQLAGSQYPVYLLRDHDLLFDLEDEGGPVRLAVDVAGALGLELDGAKGDVRARQPHILRGFELALALGQCFLFWRLGGYSQRRALHGTLELYESFSRAEKTHLQQVLEGRVLDSGNLFSLFLRKAARGGDGEAGRLWRDQQVTWLLGQDQIDLPYHREAAQQVLSGPEDPDEKRLLLFEVLRDYNREVEGDNIARQARQTRQLRRQLVFGRMSRAFHNQATLFADAVLLQPEAGWADLAAALGQAVGGHVDLHPASEALRLLLEGQDEVPLVQLEGACEQLEEAILEVQKGAMLESLARTRGRVEDHADEWGGGAPPALAAEQSAIAEDAQQRLGLVEDVRRTLLEGAKRHAAYVIISQRPSPTGSHLLVKINEFEEPYLGKAGNLRKLVRLAGDRIYSSPDYRWLEVADHWVEAIPLFIKEKVQVVDGQETAQTVIDIAGMEESFREEMADNWARNIRRVMESEFLALGRQIVGGHLDDAPGVEEAALEQARTGSMVADIVAVAVLVEGLYRLHLGAVQQLVDEDEMSPFEALRQVLLEQERAVVEQLIEHRGKAGSWAAAAQILIEESGLERGAQIGDWAEEALLPRRPLPTLHILTTQSAGMTEGYIRTWLEESMALFWAIEQEGLHRAVEDRQARYRDRIEALGIRVIGELGIWVEVEEAAARGQLSQGAAVRRVVGSNRSVQEELAYLGVLLECEEEEQGPREAACSDETGRVEECLREHAEELQLQALEGVAERNRQLLQPEVDQHCRAHPELTPEQALLAVVQADEHYRVDLDTYTRFAARRRVLEDLARERPSLQQRVRTYLRRYQRLAKTTARKALLAEQGLNALTLDPRCYFQATGGSKRYHLLYTPSRVDLGERERESVETWAQWVGGADRAAARVGRQIYGLINKSVCSYDSLTQPELLKTGENASMASHFAFSNALALMVNASRFGDIEDMGDQMSRRRDRLIHPAGEAYGGYCVPKDGLFLEFVLTLTRAEKLSQIGVPDQDHERVVELARQVMARRDEFATQGEWETWAGQALGSGAESLAGLFQVTRVGHVLDNLGRPEPHDSYRVTSALAAHWGIHKMVAGGEHVNRFMPFFKTWLIRQGVAQAQGLHGDRDIAAAGPVVVLSAEYKPDTQDGRFSAGMRKFEILTGTGNHLLYSLDAEGQDLATLMSEGYQPLAERGRAAGLLRQVGIDPADEEAVAGASRLFPIPARPAEIRVVSPTGLSTQDLLNYTSDTELEDIAAQVESRLLAAGFSETEIEANVLTWGPALEQWKHQGDLDGTAADLAAELGGRLHALALQVTGPERSYERALQGADVFDLGIPHRQVLALLEDPNRLCGLMLESNPNSALVLVDGASGARRRAMNRRDIMLWFAAGERCGRQAVYAGIGLGQETVEGWRAEMRRLRRRAERLGEAVRQDQPGRARRLFQDLVEIIRQDQEVQLQLGEDEKLRRFGRDRDRDRQIASHLARLGRGLPLEEVTFADFLALGGLYLLDGAPQEEIRTYRQDFEAGLQRLGGGQNPDPGRPIEDLLHPMPLPQAEEFREEKGIESSNKATEEVAVVALGARRQLAVRIAQARALNQRQAAFQAVTDETSFEKSYRAALAALGSGDGAVDEASFGAFIGHTRNALLGLSRRVWSGENPDEYQACAERLGRLCTGREADVEVWREIAGGYEDIGDFGRLAQQVREQEGEDGLADVARAGELFYILLAVETTIGWEREQEDDLGTGLWRLLADFFAETINDHFYQYRPWIYARGVGFAHYEDEALYELANAHHAWLYRYLRYVATTYTELRELSVAEQDLLLGNFLDGNQVEALGGGGASVTEKTWRSYGQLRELAFIRNDGFPLPQVFPQFDIDLIGAEQRVNHLIALPVGRTHYSRALCEGPTLNRQLVEGGRPGANLLMTRWIDIVERQGMPRPVVEASSAYLYLDAQTYGEALVRHKGMSAAEAAAAAAQVPHKGVRVAAAFNRPLLGALVYPFHGDPRYTAGLYEDCGLPYTVQSLFHTWTTYDKAKYPDIFAPETGVDMPAEIDWLASYTAGVDEAQIKRWISEGHPDKGFPGLRAFSQDYRIVMVKDAAESGGRNAGAFLLRRQDGQVDEEQLEDAVDFIYQISLQHNVSIQEVILASPEYWASEEFMQSFVERQIVDWGSPVERQRRPRTQLYGSHRIILSTADPESDDWQQKWNISHWITLNSKQLITNVGRGGTLEQFLPEYIRAEHRQAIVDKLAASGRRVLEALAAYEDKRGALYEKESGRAVGADLMGVSYGNPRYMMLDFLIAPVFAQPGGLVDIRPVFDAAGQRLGGEFLQRQGDSYFAGEIADWRVVMIEPNIGVGLWDRLALREEYHEQARASAAGEAEDLDRIGRNARIILSDLTRAGETYLAALGKGGGAGD
ncbi:MAG: hypothetical protein GKR89_27300 [Candidatus Latescibacteria bacterium]|nr:hypothetical protein [Candidatus Latescibacterota bacterium]